MDTPGEKRKDIHRHMHVYSSDRQSLGHIAEVYGDSFLVRKGIFFPSDRYIPYSAVASVEDEQVVLRMNAPEVKDMEWSIRPDYEEHAGDPTQLMYDRGHGIPDPFDETNPNHS
ncbi:MAG: DUF2171 domain-containing protein [Ktedonobacteraceae bacterium]|nr:DUF2171 domain-containing protein [Ktedonobacteraceae bacterium]